jgi:hypothetical protein
MPLSGQSSIVEAVFLPACRSRRATLLLLTIGALLFVGMQSRVAQRIPTRNTQELLTFASDPVKFPPPEERVTAGPCDTPAPVASLAVPAPPAILSSELPGSVPYTGERRAAGNVLRAPPASV